MAILGKHKTRMPAPEQTLPGRAHPLVVADAHAVLGTPMVPPFPEHMQQLIVGMGCFWGAERVFWQVDGVYTTAVGYAAGGTPNPTYAEVCSGRTGHNEVVLVVFDPAKVSLDAMLRLFWENHDPTQGMRQGNDVGTQYRSGLYLGDDGDDGRRHKAERSRDEYQQVLTAARYGPITTEILPAPAFYYAEDYHQQYLAKNPWGYCGIGGTGLSLPAESDGAPHDAAPQDGAPHDGALADATPSADAAHANPTLRDALPQEAVL